MLGPNALSSYFSTSCFHQTSFSLVESLHLILASPLFQQGRYFLYTLASNNSNAILGWKFQTHTRGFRSHDSNKQRGSHKEDEGGQLLFEINNIKMFIIKGLITAPLFHSLFISPSKVGTIFILMSPL